MCFVSWARGQPPFRLCSVSWDEGVSPPDPCSNSEAGRGPTIGGQPRALLCCCILLPGKDSELEAFSCNPTEGNLTPVAPQASTDTNGKLFETGTVAIPATHSFPFHSFSLPWSTPVQKHMVLLLTYQINSNLTLDHSASSIELTPCQHRGISASPIITTRVSTIRDFEKERDHIHIFFYYSVLL